MKIFIKTALSFLVLTSIFTVQTLACTTFCLKSKGEVLFGKNYDWLIGDGLIFVNKRGMSKTAMAENPVNPAKWISKYGSVTFNQYGRENPSGGMNEAGLVIELMWLDDTQYPRADNRPTIGTVEWIQYQLDISATVEDVIKNAENFRINSKVPLHYLVNDVQGNTATIEFLDGQLVAHKGESLPVSALTNDTYEKSVNYSKTTGTEKAQTESSFDRFTRAAQKTKEFEKEPKTEQEAVTYAFNVLAGVAQRTSTQWRIVYDQKRFKIHFRTMHNKEIRSINVKAFDFSCGTAVKIFDIDADESGDVTALFKDYTNKANRDLIERAFSGTPFLRDVPAMVKDAAASYPESFTCSLKSQEKTTVSAHKTDAGFFSYIPILYVVQKISEFLSA